MRFPKLSVYYHGLSPRTESLDNLAIMLEMDKLYLEFPYFGARRMLTHLSDTYKDVNIKRIRRLMRLMDLKAIYPEPKTSIANKEHKKYPYLLRNVVITHPNHVWSTLHYFARWKCYYSHISDLKIGRKCLI